MRQGRSNRKNKADLSRHTAAYRGEGSVRACLDSITHQRLLSDEYFARCSF
jgi:hypothetical protein